MNFLNRYLSIHGLLSWPVMLFGTLWAVLFNLTDPFTGGAGKVLERIALLLALQAIMFGSFWVANLLLVRCLPARLRGLALLTALIVLAGARGAAVGWAMHEIGVVSFSADPQRVFASVISQGIMLGLAAIIYELIRYNAEARGEVLAARAQLETIRQHDEREQQLRNQALVDSVRQQLQRAISFSDADTPAAVLSTLQASIDEVVRPLSRVLDRQPGDVTLLRPTVPTHIPWRELIRPFFDLRELRPIPTTILVFLGALPSVSRVFPAPLISSGLTLLLIALTAALVLVVRLALRWSPAALAIAMVPSLIVSASIASLMLQRWVLPGTSSFFVPWTLLVVIMGVMPAGAMSYLHSARELTESIVRENTNLEWVLARSRGQVRQRQRAVASVLHSRVQAALTAAYLRLQIALRDGGDVQRAVRNAQTEAELALQIDLTDEASAPAARDIVQRVIDSWAGVVDIRSEFSADDCDRIDQDALCARSLNEILLELCLNAAKHGGASEIEIGCAWPDARTCELRVHNTGAALGAEAEGLGTRLLDETTLRWSRSSDRDGVTVTALLPWSPTS